MLGDTVVAFSVGFIGDLGANRWTRDYCKFLETGIFMGDRPILGLTGAFVGFEVCGAYGACNLTIVEFLWSQPLLPRRVVFI